MTNNKTTKRALFSSVVALLLCFTMLLGTTFAWFTDSEASGRNTIQSGNLDVVLEYKTDWDSDWAPVTESTKLFKEGALYEPGYTEVVFLRVSNAGNLALKYNLNVNVYSETTSTNVAGETFSLKDYLEIGYYVQDEMSSGANYADILMPVMFGTREAALSKVTTTKLSADTGIICADSPVLAGDDTAQVVAIVLTMPTTVGNEANHKTGVAAPTIDLGVTLVATQYTHEYDSYDNQYDKDATYPVTTAEQLLAAIATASDGDVISIANNIKVGSEDILVNKSLSFVGSGDATLTDAVFVVGSGTEVSFDNLAFEGRSYILYNKLTADSSISVTNCNITMSNTTSADNRNNMKVAFVVGAGETYGEGAKGLKVVFNNNTFIPGTNNASSPVAFASWANLDDGSEFIGNTFGSEAAPIINGFAIKSANAMDKATVTVADNTVYMKTGAWTYLQAFDFFQNCSRDSAYSVVSKNNTVIGDTTGKDGSVVYFVYLEGNTYTNVSFTDTGSTLNGKAVTVDDVRQSGVKGSIALN